MQRTSNRFGPAFAIAAMIGCGGGSHHATGPTPNGAAIAHAATPDADEDDDPSTPRRHHHGGFAMLVAISLDQLDPTADQIHAIAKIRDDLRDKLAPARTAEHAVLVTLGQGIAVGTIDHAKIDEQITALETEARGVHDAVAGSLDALHATLLPSQRAALAAQIEAHFARWHRVNSKQAFSARDKHGGHLGKLARELGLSQQQIDAIQASFAKAMADAPKFDYAAAQAHVKAFGDAFASDHFDAHALASSGPINADMTGYGITRTVRFYEAVTAALTPDQRAKLADRLTHHPDEPKQ